MKLKANLRLNKLSRVGVGGWQEQLGIKLISTQVVVEVEVGVKLGKNVQDLCNQMYEDWKSKKKLNILKKENLTWNGPNKIWKNWGKNCKKEIQTQKPYMQRMLNSDNLEFENKK